MSKRCDMRMNGNILTLTQLPRQAGVMVNAEAFHQQHIEAGGQQPERLQLWYPETKERFEVLMLPSGWQFQAIQA